jgi:hypothetical protein
MGQLMSAEKNHCGPGSRLAGLQPLCFLLLFAALAAPAHANTSIFSNAGTACQNISAASWCQDLSAFGVLTGLGDAVKFNGAAHITNSFDIGLNGKNGTTLRTMTFAGTNTFASGTIIDFADAPVRSSTNSCSGTQNLCGPNSANIVIGGTTYHPNASPVVPVDNSTTAKTLISNATTDLNNINSYLHGLTSSVTFGAGSGGLNNTTTVNVLNGTLNGTSTRVFNATNYSQAGSLILGCGGDTATCANTIVVAVLNGTTAAFKYNITLADGLTSDQVIYFLNSTATITATVSNNAGFTIDGDFFAGNRADQITLATSTKPVTLSGRLYGSSVTFNAGGVTMSDGGLYTPEPGTWALWISGLGGLVWLGRRRRNRQHAGDRPETAPTAAE